MQAEDYSYLYELEESFWWFAGMREITASLLDTLVSGETKKVILDAGCGTGGNLAWLERYAVGGKVVGLDFNNDALRFCSGRKHERLLRASIADLPFADSSIDLLTSFDVLGQLPVDGSAERAISEMYRVLKPGGVCFTRVAAYEWMRSEHDAALGTYKRFTLGELKSKMEQAGFQTLRATYANSFLLPLAAVRRLALKPLGLANAGSDVKPLAPNLHRLNHLLTGALKREARWLKHPRRKLAAGLSAICVVRK